MKKFSEFKRQLFRDRVLKKAYDDLEPEFQLVTLFIKRRLEKKLTQKELARRIGTRQSAIARFESGAYNPTVDFLNKVAAGLNTRIKISIDSK